jgi:8-oxo-dGTP pyrophosphatase MutT (NUDIX family)
VTRPSLHGPRDRAGGFIVRGTGDALEVVLMHRFRAERGEYFVVPGGGVEAFETVLEAAQRELEEETGLEFEVLGKLYESVNPDSTRVAHYFLARYLGGEPVLHEGSPEALERQETSNRYTPTWVRADAILELPLFPSVIRDRLALDLHTSPQDCPLRLLETD